ncbi:MAG: M15 family metallopeptidase, partial [Methyloligellaceae bacterium]
KFLKYLKPSAGTYNCRTIAGTKRLSVHAFGAAIDINVKYADYWRWRKPDARGRYAYRNRIPWEIVEIFEKHGFIWGGKWYHYDTMHFEYRPELLRSLETPAKPSPK